MPESAPHETSWPRGAAVPVPPTARVESSNPMPIRAGL